MTALVDTNILVYRFDQRDDRKRQIATELLRDGVAKGTIRIAHQALVEFYAAVTRSVRGAFEGLLDPVDATYEVEEMMMQFDVLYPDARVVRAALRAAAAYRLSWYDAHMWAYAEVYGLSEILSEDFSHNQYYGGIRVRNPFV